MRTWLLGAKLKDPIYVVDPSTQETVAVQPTTFSALNVKERKDLQAWLMKCPEVLGEPFLLITSEFDKFDKYDKRLDLLLLDGEGVMVVAELKLDASGTLADQQAIRYAAFCSTMTMNDVVQLLSRSTPSTLDEAEKTICGFLKLGSLPDLDREPRIILVAGGFDDQELTATVMWLRKFGVDISCVELTPYRYPGDDVNVLLVPRTIIPLAEARDYQIGIERKEKEGIVNLGSNCKPFFQAAIDQYSALNPQMKGPKSPGTGHWTAFRCGYSTDVLYVWLVRRRSPRFVDVALTFESNDRDLNFKRLDFVLKNSNLGGMAHEMISGPYGKNWAQLTFRIPYSGESPSDDIAKEAGCLMAEFVDKTVDAVKKLQNL